ncbi:TOBE domain-containing protein [Saccharopolyspora sp. NFXS83]|uniref:TOBE domain-containing protein n=1 Tax=Saccharopolyspora sp. NFXS83 TaxID=2993560 RepID=UPI003A4E40D3
MDAAPAVRGLLHRVLREQRQPTVLVTHDVLDAVVLADRVAVLVDGRIIEQGPTRRVLTRPAAAFTARIAGLNLLTGAASDGGLVFAGIPVTGRTAEDLEPGKLEPGEQAAAVFSPSAVAVHRDRPHASPRNAVPVRINALEPRGDVVRLRAETRTPDPVVLAADVTPAAVADLGMSAGDDVFFVVKAAEVAIHPVSGGSSGA